MIKINFSRFGVYTGILRKEKRMGDVREEFADLLYRNVSGIRSHALALKIYSSKGDTEYTVDEVRLIKSVAEAMCLPGFIDGLNEILENQTINE